MVPGAVSIYTLRECKTRGARKHARKSALAVSGREAARSGCTCSARCRPDYVQLVAAEWTNCITHPAILRKIIKY